jgi:uncharacterized membrane protein
MRETSLETTDGRHVPSLVVRTLYSALLVVVLVAGLLYPILGVTHRMFVETGRTRVDFEIAPSLNGGGTISGNDDYQAALCLGELAQGDDVVLASAVGGSYNWPSGIASTYTGIPTVFNWPGHEAQWRGPTYGEVSGSRESDMNLLFSDPTWNTARMIINKYGIDYIFFGSSERDKFGSASETKFQDNLELVCASGATHVFHVPEQSVVGAR